MGCEGAGADASGVDVEDVSVLSGALEDD